MLTARLLRVSACGGGDWDGGGACPRTLRFSRLPPEARAWPVPGRRPASEDGACGGDCGNGGPSAPDFRRSPASPPPGRLRFFRAVAETDRLQNGLFLRLLPADALAAAGNGGKVCGNGGIVLSGLAAAQDGNVLIGKTEIVSGLSSMRTFTRWRSSPTSTTVPRPSGVSTKESIRGLFRIRSS